MRVVVVGGTRFVGRAIVEDLAAAGHDLLLVHRGTLEPEGMPDAAHLHTERKDLLSHKNELAAFKPDAAIVGLEFILKRPRMIEQFLRRDVVHGIRNVPKP